jgi:hypothetical protein
MAHESEVQAAAKSLLYFNGINAATGEYEIPPMTAEELTGFVLGESPPENLAELRFRHRQKTERHLGVVAGVDPTRLDQAGWGVIFAYEDRDRVPAIKEALGELLQLRQEQAGDRYREYTGPDAYRPDESKSAFLARHGIGPGPADPDKVPYYLLIVGDPETIPYRFQYQLDVQYAVGRLHFETLEEYAQYARSVVTAEKGAVKLPRQAAFWGPRNPDDPATGLSSEMLAGQLASALGTDQPEWTTETYLAEQATKAQLGQLLGGGQTPSLLFTASHGMGFPLGDARQLPHQGALLCQDWPGPLAWHGDIPHDFYFAGDDLRADARLLGLIAFHFACFGAGTPRLDDFAHRAPSLRRAIAPHAFIANLPRGLLGHPRGGALAVVGHVERAWGYSFLWPHAGAQLGVFESTLKRLMAGYPVGAAIEYFDERYAELSTVLTDELEDVKFGKTPDYPELAGMWTANNDARSYTIVGDPAVRLPIGDAAPGEAERPTINAVEVSTPPDFEPGPTTTAAQPEPPATAPPVTGGPGAYVLSGTVTLQPAGAAMAPAEAYRVPPSGEVAFWEPFWRKRGEGEDEDREETRRSLLDAIKGMAESAAKAVAAAAADVVTLEVATYTSDQITQVERRNLAATANLRAVTVVKPDGDIDVCVPRKEDGDIDQALWQVHADMVQQAQANRAALFKTVVDAVSYLAKL